MCRLLTINNMRIQVDMTDKWINDRYHYHYYSIYGNPYCHHHCAHYPYVQWLLKPCWWMVFSLFDGDLSVEAGFEHCSKMVSEEDTISNWGKPYLYFWGISYGDSPLSMPGTKNSRRWIMWIVACWGKPARTTRFFWGWLAYWCLYSREWMGMGLLGWLLLVMTGIIPENPLRKTHQ